MRVVSFIVLIDSFLLRKGVVAVLSRMKGVRVLKEFATEDPFIAYLKSHLVDYLIMGKAEFDRASDLFISKPGLLEKTVLIYGPDEKGAESGSPQKDAQTSIYLNEDKESIIRKIQSLLDPGVLSDSESPTMRLSPRETTIVRMVSMGMTNREIAEKLFLSAHTVMTHRKNINNKLGIKSVSGLTIYAIVNNIITIEEVSSLPAK